ncbi:hypothetical protein M514_11648 [Trichuris suis]|uniref:Uncharacterized protein n=1 Tax=Trichuris suis TaxID=68888 RepID=A0A085MT06_9BILA|nr:hypothetical protein M513_11648 [Trichuris suis]KFD60352.1 hypothetical protein M514_11648 [Trichuris suis]
MAFIHPHCCVETAITENKEERNQPQRDVPAAVVSAASCPTGSCPAASCPGSRLAEANCPVPAIYIRWLFNTVKDEESAVTLVHEKDLLHGTTTYRKYPPRHSQLTSP